MLPPLRYSTDHVAILKLAHDSGRTVHWVIKHLLTGVRRNEQRTILKEWASAFHEVYGIADYEALQTEAKRCGFFTSLK